MTVEELKKIANSMGYRLAKKYSYESLLPCFCGSNRRKTFYDYTNKDSKVTFRCVRCGFSVSDKSVLAAKRSWNNIMRDLKAEEE